MKKQSFVLIVLLYLFSGCSEIQKKSVSKESNVYAVIPQPTQLKEGEGKFLVSEDTWIVIPAENEEVKQIAEMLAQQINLVSGYHLKIETSDKKGNHIFFKPSMDKSLGEEGYTIEVNADKVRIEANHPRGYFYALQTVLQLLPPEIFSDKKADLAEWTIPACSIKDVPRFSYRGLHLDVGIHFFPVSFVKKYIDLIALHKMNTFHWHLTEDQGWRIEIKKYPKLTEIGSIRKETVVGKKKKDRIGNTYDGKEYGGFYTQDEIKEVIKYAQSKHITIIPEIELPGHALAALASYPELGCTGGPYEVATNWGIFEDVFCPTEKTFEFLENVLAEVMDLFPGKYIHIGGDECPKESWKKSSFCQNLIKKEGLKDEHELQSYFIRRIEKFVNSKGKKIIGWDEILEGGLAPDATVMSWRGIEGGIAAAKEGHDVIMTPTSHCYLDYYQDESDEGPLAIGKLLNLQMVYEYEPVPTELNEKEAKYVLGTQANVWTEYMKTTEQVEYMVFPRAIALAEVAWSPKESKNYDDFTKRLLVHFKRLDKLNVNYANKIGKEKAN